jgi:hypothetical protein
MQSAKPWQQRAAIRNLQKRYQRRRVYWHAGSFLFIIASAALCDHAPGVTGYLGLNEDKTKILQGISLAMFIPSLFMTIMGLQRCDQSTNLASTRKHTADAFCWNNHRYKVRLGPKRRHGALWRKLRKLALTASR